MRRYGFKSHKAVVYIIPVIFLVFEELLKIGGIVNYKSVKSKLGTGALQAPVLLHFSYIHLPV